MCLCLPASLRLLQRISSHPWRTTAPALPACLPPRSPVGIHQAENVLGLMTVKAVCWKEATERGRCGNRSWLSVTPLLDCCFTGGAAAAAAAAANILQIQTCTGQGSKCLRFSAVELYADEGLINAPYSSADGARLAELTCHHSPITSATNEIVLFVLFFFCITTQSNY